MIMDLVITALLDGTMGLLLIAIKLNLKEDGDYIIGIFASGTPLGGA